eukprot:scaffold2017_cov387-Prasinococcus_capsulatus_cf.AAC.15
MRLACPSPPSPLRWAHRLFTSDHAGAGAHVGDLGGAQPGRTHGCLRAKGLPTTLGAVGPGHGIRCLQLHITTQSASEHGTRHPQATHGPCPHRPYDGA